MLNYFVIEILMKSFTRGQHQASPLLLRYWHSLAAGPQTAVVYFPLQLLHLKAPPRCCSGYRPPVWTTDIRPASKRLRFHMFPPHLPPDLLCMGCHFQGTELQRQMLQSNTRPIVPEKLGHLKPQDLKMKHFLDCPVGVIQPFFDIVLKLRISVMSPRKKCHMNPNTLRTSDL